MITARHTPPLKINNHLHQSLKKQNELSNRINVLLLEKEKKLKNLQRRIIKAHDLEQNRVQKTLMKQELERSFEDKKWTEICKGQLLRQLKRQLSDSIVQKQTQQRLTKKEWYHKMKAIEKQNKKSIQRGKQAQLQLKKQSKNQVKLTELCIKQNIRKYWDERLSYIQECKQKDTQLKAKLFKESLSNIQLLQQKEKKLLQQIRRGKEYQNKLRNENFNVFFEQQRPFMTWRNTQSLS